MADADHLRSRLAEAVRGEYEVLEELGRGGMATVYLAHDLSLDRRVAIKVLAPHLLATDGMAERFLMEAKLAAGLAHPHIIPIYAVRRREEVLYFVMKYVAGQALDRVLRSTGPLPVPMVRAILTQVGSALEVAHRRGVVHRDIKPANILLDESGDAIVADFGIARVVEQPGATQAGQTLGTPAYMSPEQCAGTALTGAADQYALGVVAYELLTGAPPFTGENLLQIVWRMMHEPPIPLAQRCPESAGDLANAVHRMFRQKAGERWPTVTDAVAALGPLTLGPADPVRRAMMALATNTAAPDTRHSRPTQVTPSARVGSLTFHVTSGTMTIDDMVPLVPEIEMAGGQRPRDDAWSPTIQWSSSDPAVARVSADGVVTATGIGSARITARCDELPATLQVSVTRVVARDLVLTPRATAVDVGDRFTLGISTKDSEGQLPSPRLVAWSSSDPAVATVDAMGRVVICGEGTVEISARTGGARATRTMRVGRPVIAAVTVTPQAEHVAVGDQLRFAATPANPKGHQLVGFATRWEVSDSAIAAITPEGVLTALRGGQVMVAARVAGRVGTARLTVSPRA